MKMIKNAILCGLVWMTFSGCVALPRTTFTPIVDPMERLQFEGFSILPPGEGNWSVATPRYKSDAILPGEPDGVWQAWFRMRQGEGGALVGIRTWKLYKMPIDDPQELLKHLAAELRQNPALVTGTEKTSRLLGFKAWVDRCLSWNCLRYEGEAEDRDPRFKGNVRILTFQGYLFLHPDSPSYIVLLEFGEMIESAKKVLFAEKDFHMLLKSLAFTSIK